MSSMLEQAIVDATALREAALKNAEQAIIEKYAPQIKERLSLFSRATASRLVLALMFVTPDLIKLVKFARSMKMVSKFLVPMAKFFLPRWMN